MAPIDIMAMYRITPFMKISVFDWVKVLSGILDPPVKVKGWEM
jgi:hypothetical protein